jgi:hypothetical protein
VRSRSGVAGLLMQNRWKSYRVVLMDFSVDAGFWTGWIGWMYSTARLTCGDGGISWRVITDQYS